MCKPRRGWLLLIPAILLLASTPMRAQTPRVLPNTPITVEWESPQGAAQGIAFRAVVDDQITKNFVASDLTITPPTAPATNNVYRATIPGVAPGNHTLRIRAYATSQPTLQQDSAALAFTADPVAPVPPTGLRIITVTVTGQLRLEVKDESPTAIANAVASQVLRLPAVVK